MPIRAASAGTKEPAWASTAISAFWRRKVDLPAMLGPVTSQQPPPLAGAELAIVGDEARAALPLQRLPRPPDGGRPRCAKAGSSSISGRT